MPLTNLYFYFIIFCVVAIYYIFPNSTKWIILLISSLIFYMGFAGKMALLLMMGSAIVAYIGARGIAYLRLRKELLMVKIVFGIAIGIIVGILGWYNYLNFFIENFSYIAEKLGCNIAAVFVKGIAPLGISFYSFSLISYLTDVYWGTQKEEKNIGKVILYACYFPVITTGPILKYDGFQKQLEKLKSFSVKNICFSLQRILWGVFKKTVLADYFYIIEHDIFKNYLSYSGGIILAGIYLSGIQLYLDFSASIDIVLGISQLFEVELPENFEKPFSSCTITELFRKWHMSLGNWLKDYIYYPLMKSSFIQNLKDRTGKRFGKKTGKRVSTFGTMLVMWIVNGFWHGAKWKYIIGVGVLLWGIMLLENLFEPYRLKIVQKCSIDEKSKLYLLMRRVIMYTKFSAMMIFFCADGVMHGVKILHHMLRNFFVKPDFTFLTSLGFSTERILILLMEFCVYLWIVYIGSKIDVREWLINKKIWFRWGIYYWIILSILLFSANGTNVMQGFIYAQF